MTSTTVTIIGAGQAGLSMSRCLSERSIDHVLLERGEVANSWKTERWDSLRLLTPNWMTRLPDGQYAGDDPNGYMTATEVAKFLETYGAHVEAPVIANTVVESVRPTDDGFRTVTNNGEWVSKAVVVATGACSTPRIPEIAGLVPGNVRQLAPIHYRNPGQLDSGRVLVVGASASGAQIADELARSGRAVTLAVGDHVRLPRTYRGMDIHWWMDSLGLLDERIADVEDISRARRLPSLQLVGSPEGRDIGLNELARNGVDITGRLVGVSGSTAQFSGSFANSCASADLKQGRLLEAIDEFALATGLESELPDPTRPSATELPAARLTLSLDEVSTVVWATGFVPNYPWLDTNLLDRKGAIRHDGGVMAHPGMYVLGLPFLRRRKSTFLDGVGFDAKELATHLNDYLANSVASPLRTGG